MQTQRPDSVSLQSVILCVEDNPINRKVLQWGLAPHHEVVFAVNDREACDVLRSDRHRIAHVLMDIGLQGSILDGIALARLFTGRDLDVALPDYAKSLPTLDVPLHFVTAYGDEYDHEFLVAAGAIGVFRKPIDFRRLLQAMPS